MLSQKLDNLSDHLCNIWELPDDVDLKETHGYVLRAELYQVVHAVKALAADARLLEAQIVPAKARVTRERDNILLLSRRRKDGAAARRAPGGDAA